MHALLRERIRLLLWIVAISAVIGAVYRAVLGASVTGVAWPPRLADVMTGIMNGALISGSIGAIEIFLLNAGRMRRLATLPFVAVVALKTVVYGAIVVAVLVGGTGTQATALTVGFSLAVTLIFVVTMQVVLLLGFRTARDLFLGRYRRPRRERRFFLFVDVVGSTAIAERLGPLEAHRFLSAVFAAVAEPVAACRGEIYQYIGDEVVITWTEQEGALEARPLRCFFLMETSLRDLEEHFRKQFAAAPKLRAALHLGEVIAGEVGVWRRAIVFHGDVMNTASRLENATREVGQRFIASADAMQAFGPLPELASRDLGALALRGRSEPIRAYGIERFEGAAG